MALHWLTAVLVVANLCLAISMVPLPLSPQKFRWYAWHKWIGVTVFFVTCIRLAVRSLGPIPGPGRMPRWQVRAAAISHGFLYVLLLVIPLSGWLYSSSAGVQVVYLGIVPLPDLLPKDRDLAVVLRIAHVAFNVGLVTVLSVHIAAAVKHHFVDGDGVLTRMVPGLKPRGTLR